MARHVKIVVKVKNVVLEFLLIVNPILRIIFLRVDLFPLSSINGGRME